MLFISGIMVLVGVVSAASPFIIQKLNSKEKGIVFNEISLLKNENKELREKIQRTENLYRVQLEKAKNIEANLRRNRELLEKLHANPTQPGT